MSKLGKAQLSSLLGRPHDECSGVILGSVHLNGYPNPGDTEWVSTQCTLPRGGRRQFDVRVNEEVLPEGLAIGGDTKNADVLAAYQRWQRSMFKDLRAFQPGGIFVGLGFDLHQSESKLTDKRVGMGI